MFNTKLIPHNEYRVQPWKNGFGETREIAVDTTHPFRWRLSSAILAQSGPFSHYPDYDRVFVLLNGGPVLLQRPGHQKHLHAMESYSFKGEWETHAEVSAPCDDFNVFALRPHAQARAYPSYLSQAEELQFPLAGNEHFIFCVEGSIEVVDPNTRGRFVLAARDTFQASRLTHREFLNLRAKGLEARNSCIWVVVHLASIPSEPSKT